MSQGSATATIVAFNRAVVEATSDLVAAYKPNIAFYEGFGPAGLGALHETIATIRALNPDVVIILDAKRADIGHTNTGYVTAAFEYLGVDATTINPYLGFDSLTPYAAQHDKLMFVLCRTSNTGAGEFQDLIIDGDPLFLHVARRVATHWNGDARNFGLVVGATSPQELALIRREAPELPLLIPGVGAQGGDVASVARAVLTAGEPNVLVNSSRGILYHESAEAGTTASIRRAAMELAEALASSFG
jgi:orotidine-5'-phosphate decarboxylase